MSEFDLIRRYFSRPPPAGILGAGDDCALVPGGPGAWAISTDLLLEGRHFFPDVAPQSLGHKALAVNLSDLAAMGASPRGFVLGLALPAVDAGWLAAFSEGLHALADRFHCPLVGGDTTRSENGITLAVTVFGATDARRALRRDAARPGDDIWVSGTLGEADLALRLLLLEKHGSCSALYDDDAPGAGLPSNDALNAWLQGLPHDQRRGLLEQTRERLEAPTPRVELGLALRGVAQAAIDVSDGLVQDLGHVTQASACGAVIHAAHLPLADSFASLAETCAWRLALGGGDAYELCFTAAPDQREKIAALAEKTGVRITRIGHMVDGRGTIVLGSEGTPLAGVPKGYDHFAS